MDPPLLGYDAAMPVDDRLAFNLLKNVSELEFRLRRHGDFFSTWNGRPTPDVNWHEVQERVRVLDSEFLDLIVPTAKLRLLSQRETRPMKQQIVQEGDRLVARYRPRRLDPASDAVAVVQAMRQVRNNLFHGGKQDAEEDPYEEDDDWVNAATQVALALQRALAAGLLDTRA